VLGLDHTFYTTFVRLVVVSPDSCNSAHKNKNTFIYQDALNRAGYVSYLLYIGTKIAITSASMVPCLEHQG
jgi:hypothetical protein